MSAYKRLVHMTFLIINIEIPKLNSERVGSRINLSGLIVANVAAPS